MHKVVSCRLLYFIMFRLNDRTEVEEGTERAKIDSPIDTELMMILRGSEEVDV